VRTVDQIAKSPGWTFLTNHGHVLVCLARDPNTRLRDIAQQVGITERAVQRIVGELEEAGYVERTKVGRRNSYVLHAELPLRHPLERDQAVGSLLEALDALGVQEGRDRS
jgi:DNA-binding Lrp family transcriptional regulator